MTAVRKRSVTIRGHRTSISLEQPFFDGLQDIAAQEGLSFMALVTRVDAQRDSDENLSSALRVFVLDHYRGIARQ